MKMLKPCQSIHHALLLNKTTTSRKLQSTAASIICNSIADDDLQPTTTTTVTMPQAPTIKIKRPSLDDVLRISEGRGAKKRGTGSRQVPHRLNAEERQAFNIARQKGFLTMKGSGYRKERKGSPLANIFRQLQDALGNPVFVIEQGSPLDIVLVDLSTLRQLDTSKEEEALCELLKTEFGLSPIPSYKLASPFTIILPTEALSLIDLQSTTTSSSSSDDDDDDEHTQQQQEKQQQWSEEDLEAAITALEAPIWQQPPRLVGFACDRPTGKAVSKVLADKYTKKR